MRTNNHLSAQISTETLLRDKAWQQSIIDGADYTIIATDAKGIILTFNATATRQLGYKPDEIIGKANPTLILDPLEIERRAQQLSKNLKAKVKPGFEALVANARRGTTGESDWTFIRKDGSRYLANLSVTVLRDGTGALSGFLLIGKDVTQQRAAEAALRDSEEIFRMFMDNSPIEAFIKDEAGCLVYINKSYERRFNVTLVDWKGKNDFELWGEENGHLLRNHDLEVLAKGKAVSFLEEAPTPEGNLTHWLSYKIPLTNAQGQKFLAGMSLDITRQKKTAQALRQSAEHYRDIFDSATDLIHSVSPDGQLLYANRAWQEALGYTQEEVPRLSLLQVIHPNSYPHYMEVFTRVVEGETVDNFETAFITKDGAKIVVEGSSSCKFQDGWPIATRSIFHDITQRKRDEEAAAQRQKQIEEAKAQLEELSQIDVLTKLQNRRAFEGNLHREIARAVRQKTAVSLLLLDIDHFKPHNDALGHSAGDEVLRQFAQLLAEIPRCTDMIARYGGEDFAVILPDTAREGAMISAERFRQKIESAAWQGRNLTVSIGVATFVSSGTPSQSTLVEEATRALSQSKQEGRNRVTHYG